MPVLSIEEPRKSQIQDALLAWFEANQRDFPWRETDDVFHILLAEKLLQQTKARDILVEVYERLVEKYPTPFDLAEAEISDIEAIIYPLGLLYRAHELREMAREIVQSHDGTVPFTLVELLNLTGIGDYCARAVLCFGYSQHVAIVDANVARFYYRLTGITEPLPTNPARSKDLQLIAALMLPYGQARQFNLSILDLCAGVCTARNPQCGDCPLVDYCVYGVTQETRA